jgi:hypothetical protein
MEFDAPNQLGSRLALNSVAHIAAFRLVVAGTSRVYATIHKERVERRGPSFGQAIGLLLLPRVNRVDSRVALNGERLRLPARLGKRHIVERTQSHPAPLASEPIAPDP